jgi:hypothetical protein
MIENFIQKAFTMALYAMVWYFSYIILGFEVTVIAILLFILAELRG